MSKTLNDDRSIAHRKEVPRALSPREQLALTILHGEWSLGELKMCFEVSNPERHMTELSKETTAEIANFEAKKAVEDIHADD